MPLLPNLLGFSAFGLAVRAFQLGIQRKPVASGPVAYLLSGAGFGAVGYVVTGWEQRQAELILEKEDLIRQRKLMRN